jgi:hypothetical protein
LERPDSRGAVDLAARGVMDPRRINLLRALNKASALRDLRYPLRH